MRPSQQREILNNSDYDPKWEMVHAFERFTPWDGDIVTFATHKSFCGERLYPRQLTLLKLIYLQTEIMTDYDIEVIEEWRNGFFNPAHAEGVQPDIWERIEYLKSRGYRRFPHIEAVIGRRGSKGKIGGILGAESMAYLYSLDDWQAYYGISPGKDGYLSVVATGKTQATKFQFADIREAITGCEYLQRAISKNQGQALHIRTPADLRRIAYMRSNKIPMEYEIASLRAIPMSSQSSTGRGATGFCLDPETPVLTADLRWVPIREVRPGDELVGVDETPERGKHRKIRKSTVKATMSSHKAAYRITFDDDSSVVCSEDHPWLTRDLTGGRNYKWKSISGEVDKPRAWGLRVGSQILQLVQPWEEDQSREAGYLAGVYDGEGHLSLRSTTASGLNVYFSQNPGTVLDSTLSLMREKGFHPQPQNSNAYLPPSEKQCQQWAIRGVSEVFRFLGQVRPLRLVEKADQAYEGISVRGKGTSRYDQPTHMRTITSIEKLPEQELIDIETTTHTFIANGLVSHNCNFFDEFAHMLPGSSSRSGEEVYEAYQPSLDQFGKDSLTYIPSSPFTKTGRFYSLYKEGSVLMSTYDDDTGRVGYERKTLKDLGMSDGDAEEAITELNANPEMLIVQLPSWGLYRDWKRAPELVGHKITHPIQSYDDRMKRLEKSNPEKFRVERKSQFASVLNAWLDPQKVDAIFDNWQGRELKLVERGILKHRYYMHADPALSGDNFALAIGHTEDAPADEHGDVWPHVVIDYMKVWRPSDYPDGRIDYIQVLHEISDILKRFPSTVTASFDQWQNQAFIPVLKRDFPHINVTVENFTAPANLDRMERFKTALNLGWIHSPRDRFFDDQGNSLLEMEMKFLQKEKNKVDHPGFGPVTTKDLFDCVNVVTDRLLKDALDIYNKRMLGAGPSIGSTNINEIRSGRAQIGIDNLTRNSVGRSARQVLNENRESALNRKRGRGRQSVTPRQRGRR